MVLISVLVVLALGLSATGAAQLVRSRLDAAAEIRRSSFAGLQARQIVEGVINWALVRLDDSAVLPATNVLPSAAESTLFTSLPTPVAIKSTAPVWAAVCLASPSTLAKSAAGTTTLTVTATVTPTFDGFQVGTYSYNQTVRFVKVAENQWEARRCP